MSEKKFTRNRSKHRQEIVSATKMLIEEKGYPKLSIRDITNSTGLSTGLIYKNFPRGKADIVVEICRSNIEEFASPNDFLMAPVEEFPRIFRTTIQLSLASHRKNLKLNEALEAAVLMNPDLKDQVDELIGGMIDFMPKLLENLQKQKVIDVPDTNRWGKWIVTVMDAMIHRHILYNSFHANDEEVIDFICESLSRILNLNIN